MNALPRRHFLATTAGALAGLGNLDFVSGLPRVTAAEADVDPKMVRFRPEMEPLVKLLAETPRERLLEEVAERIKGGVTYQQLLAAVFLAGVRDVQPRPVGFKFHAVLVINSAHLAAQAARDNDRWLPLFWALDQYKSSQAANVKEGNWHLPPVEESKVPPSHKARAAFIEAMEAWDPAAADAAIAGYSRTAGANDMFELFAKFGARDFRHIGHKAIYVANSWRALNTIGWEHAEPILRSLTYAIMAHDGENPSKRDAAEDRPGRRNKELAAKIRGEWLAGAPDDAAVTDMLATLRQANADTAADKVVELLNRGIAPQSIWDAVFAGANELLMRAPGIRSLHAVTTTNALHYAWKTSGNDETRRWLLLQNASFIPLFRGDVGKGVEIDKFDPVAPQASGEQALDEIFADVSKDRNAAAAKALSLLQSTGNARGFSDAARRLIYLKGTDSHDYKFSSASLEDYAHVSPKWRDRFLAASVFYFKGSGSPDNSLVKRTRAALGITG
jgi:hypothetical protein